MARSDSVLRSAGAVHGTRAFVFLRLDTFTGTEQLLCSVYFHSERAAEDTGNRGFSQIVEETRFARSYSLPYARTS